MSTTTTTIANVLTNTNNADLVRRLLAIQKYRGTGELVSAEVREDGTGVAIVRTEKGAKTTFFTFENGTVTYLGLRSRLKDALSVAMQNAARREQSKRGNTSADGRRVGYREPEMVRPGY